MGAILLYASFTLCCYDNSYVPLAESLLSKEQVHQEARHIQKLATLPDGKTSVFCSTT